MTNAWIAIRIDTTAGITNFFIEETKVIFLGDIKIGGFYQSHYILSFDPMLESIRLWNIIRIPIPNFSLGLYYISSGCRNTI